ncbi:3-hydroxyacyl-CoA dehydrogenase NAD-binding domain-containing protein [Thalassobaculum sp.]|uniref:3-hydroxyacyl-CoA dehydrogenase NAD-binding domain-containing protein n=1 Tax=Thalassobaculum sp. TaxID=2022740 RepID=UPI003B59B748
MAAYKPFQEVRRIAVLGTGTIGASWTAYFLARGYDVTAWDPAEGWKERLQAFVDNARPQLQAIGTAVGPEGTLTMVDDPATAVADSDFVQENAPERAPIKLDLYRRIDNAVPAHTVVATSTSGLILSDLQDGIGFAERLVVGHPFNPPHLIPLVEVVLGKATDRAAAEWAHGFYGHIGKHAIYVNKEVPGHLANRLQAALWREAVNAVADGLASVEDVNAAIAQGPGLRLALMGPHMVFNLTGGKGGYAAMLEQFGPPIEGWWQDMQKTPTLTPDLKAKLIEGIRDEMGDRTIDDLEAQRDKRLIALLKMLKETAA